MRKTLLFAALFALPFVAHAATDITGTWQLKVELANQTGSPTFVLRQDADTITGKYTGAFGEADMKGTIKGDDITLEFDVTGIHVHYEGRLNADGTKFAGTCDYGGQASGTFTATRSPKQ